MAEIVDLAHDFRSAVFSLTPETVRNSLRAVSGAYHAICSIAETAALMRSG
jgi:hypothetical protein